MCWALASDEIQLDSADVRLCSLAAGEVLAERPEVATVSIVAPAGAGGANPGTMRQAGGAAWPLCFLNDAVLDLLSFDRARTASTRDDLEKLMSLATRKGLVHLWLVSDRAAGPPSERIPAHSAQSRTAGEPASRRLSLGFDATWLLGAESGAQVFALQLIRELATRDQVREIVLMSDNGGVPGMLDGVGKIQGATWTAGAARERLDILHRPYQPGTDMDYRRYYAVAHSVAVTVLDFIAYDNPSYHEDSAAWRDYQRLFDVKVCRADRVFAISEYIGARLQNQFAHQLTAPVAAIHPGTDHLLQDGDAAATEPVADLDGSRFLLVLGNDFEHKNRDFAVKVFRALCDRGYPGRLALVGFHLDLGSTYAYELGGAGMHAARVVRSGAVSAAHKRWLLRHADAVLYPTSSEGFGFIPFEAAALGTPTAFVRFGPLRETLPAVLACADWSIARFADHVEALLASPAIQLGQISAAAQSLTWRHAATRTLEAYFELLDDRAFWHSRQLSEPVEPSWQRALRHPRVRRLAGAVRRFTGPGA
ncbi:MAG TPA: glycosyltransferase [Vicinamibacterales bacterium]|nr:glycosyltransferase [Vicinamibacterales bacterium]